MATGATLGVLTGCSVPFVSARATHPPRLAYLATWPPPRAGETNPFFDGLRDLGYTDGQNVTVASRYASGHLDQLPPLASELITFGPDILVADGEQAAIVAKDATSVIPTVFTAVSDPVAIGVVDSLSRPGGNITGFSDDQARTVAKHVDLALELVPGLTRLGVMWSPDYTTMRVKLQGIQAAAHALGIDVMSIQVRQREDFDGAFQSAVSAGLRVLIITGAILTNQAGAQLSELALKYRLLTIGSGDYAMIGYGPNIPALRRQAASAVVRIFKGAKPADLAVQKASTFDLTINLRLAEGIGISVPAALLSQATTVS